MQFVKFLYAVCFLIFTSAIAVAQVNEGERSMSQGSKNSLSIDLPKISAKNAAKSWKDYMHQYKGEMKHDNKSDEWFLDNAVIPGVGGANTVDVYARFNEAGEVTTETVWFDLGGAYVNSTEFRDKYDEAARILNQFALQVARDQTNQMMATSQDDLKKMDKNLRNLEKDNKNLHDDIENYKDKIRKAEAAIEKNQRDQEDAKVKLDTQRKLITDIQAKLDTLK